MIEKTGLSLLRRLDPELAHRIAIRALALGAVPDRGLTTNARLQTNIAGLDFPNPVGLAAGFDKNAEVVAQLSRSGFGFVEVGAATPLAQPGNPKPRLFRLSEDRAVINRFGFNNDGMEAISSRLQNVDAAVPIGINLGANKQSVDKASDFAAVLRCIGPFVDFATVNVSSPNTEKLRDLQGPAALAAVLTQVMDARSELDRKVPIFLKIAPDLDRDELIELTHTAIAAGVDAIIATNTTLARDGLKSKHSGESGGLSGAPLFEISTRALAQVAKATEGRIPVIGVGGISTVDDAIAKFRAGASAVQLYSAMVYKGLSLADRLVRGIDETLETLGHHNISEIVGTENGKWL